MHKFLHADYGFILEKAVVCCAERCILFNFTLLVNKKTGGIKPPVAVCRLTAGSFQYCLLMVWVFAVGVVGAAV